MEADQTKAWLVPWQLGPNWPGRRCGARTRRGTPCLKPALKERNRCQLHGGRAGGPSGEKNGAYRHGRFTKAHMAADKAARQRLKELERLGRLVGLWDDPKT